MTRESVWTKEEEKSFENAIALHWNGEESAEQWEKAASMVPTKTTDELKQYYQLLVEDVSSIEPGRVPIPNYAVEEATSSYKDHHRSDKRSNCGYESGLPSLAHDSVAHGVKGALKSEQERRKGIPWTDEEHRMFLLGLDKFGKGDWRSISRNFVMSRTPTQVASHAQKYFIRLNSMNRDRRRSSIHDITSVNNRDISSHQPPITGAGAAVHPPPVKHGAQPHTTGLGMCRTLVGHPQGLPASAIGTPVMLPPGHHPQNMSTYLKILR